MNLFLPPQCWGYRHVRPCLVLLGIQTRVLLFSQQALLPTEPFPYPVDVVFGQLNERRQK